MRHTYRYRLPWGETLWINADLAEASAPIVVRGEDEDIPTGLQTADVRHSEREMLRAVLQWCGPAGYRADGDDRDDGEILDEIVDYVLGEAN